MKRLLFSVILTAVFVSSKAQVYSSDTLSPWIISIGVGFYMAGDSPAEYYSGADNNRFLNNFSGQQYDLIKVDLGDYDFTIANGPSDLVYKNVAAFQLGINYSLNQNWSVNLQFNNVTLTAAGIFTLNVNRVNPGGNPEPFLELGQIRGEETRSHIVLSGGYSHDLGQRFYLKGQLGLDLNFVEVTQNTLTIASRDYNINFTQQNQGNNGNNFYGSGVFVAATLGYHKPAKYGIAINLNYFNSSINLNDIVKERSHILIPTFSFTKGF